MFQINSMAYGLLFSVASDTTVINSGYHVFLEPIDDEDIALMPWVGIYLATVAIQPVLVSGPAQWNATVGFSIIVRNEDVNGRLESIDALYRSIDPVISAVNSNKTLKGSVQVVDAITFEPFEVGREDENFIQAMQINIQAQQRST